ncbi:hypothetical protein [Roseovarius sp. M141]|uniref:hypothetical protein n=1 Tax=Roseovarius sp. M141 TaxID=2583806 RepID=UPI0020CD5FD2|nr:hypothetical protein [Roseovarius sp. M141]
MTFQPALAAGGLTGWSFLNRTLGQQTKAFERTPEIRRDTEYFEKNIAQARTAPKTWYRIAAFCGLRSVRLD